jgi:hypothetical protein
MPRLVVAALAGIALCGVGCADTERPLPAACTDGGRAVAVALRRAPGPVVLRDGTRLSTCIERARADAEIQTVGSIYTRVAGALAVRARASDGAALRLGYLIGAARRGARRTSGIHEELVRRLEQTVGVEGPTPVRQPSFNRGLAAGARTG